MSCDNIGDRSMIDFGNRYMKLGENLLILIMIEIHPFKISLQSNRSLFYGKNQSSNTSISWIHTGVRIGMETCERIFDYQ